MSTARPRAMPASIARLQTDPDRRIRLAIEHVADLMREIHGGDWWYILNHQSGVVALYRRDAVET